MMKMTSKRLTTSLGVLLAGGLLALQGCGSDAFDAGTPGSLEVVISTTGQQLDPDGYTVILNDGAQEESVGVDDVVVFEALPAGAHSVRLAGIAANCMVDNGPNPRTVQVPGGGQAQTEFAVVCVDPQTQVIAFSRLQGGVFDVWRMNEDGSGQVNLTNNPAMDIRPMTSRDGFRIAFESDRAGAFDVWTMLIDGSGLQNVTANSADDLQPSWSEDGEKIAFVSERGGGSNIWLMDSDGTDPVQLTTTGQGIDRQPAVSPDGSQIAFVRIVEEQTDVWIMNVDGSGQTNLTQNVAEDLRPSWFPDGSRIAFSSDRDGAHDVWVMDADGSNPTNLTSNPGANDAEPAVSPDGSRVAFTSDRNGDPCVSACGFWDTNGDIWVMDADGTNQTDLTQSPGSHEEDPAWES